MASTGEGFTMFANGEIWVGFVLGLVMAFLAISVPLFNRFGSAKSLLCGFGSFMLTGMVWSFTTMNHIALALNGEQILAAAGAQLLVSVIGSVVYTLFLMDEKTQASL